jgi:CHASE3 domain sensor protein
MTIGKKLYLGFGAILAIMLVLFVVNLFTVRREYNARATVKDTLANVQTIENIRLQMMENRLFLGNYLLSGDLRDEDKTNKGVNDLLAVLKDAESKVGDASLRVPLAQVDENERGWSDNFAKPMMAKRHQVDSGDATVSDLLFAT